MRRVLPLLLIALACVAAAQDELAEWLGELQRQPLDLRHVDVEELARLPWIDRIQAEAIIGLRTRGGLHAVEDLLRARILDDAEWRAIEPFVTLSSPQRRLRLRGEFVSRWRVRSSTPRTRGDVGAWQDAWSLRGREDGRALLAHEGARTRWGVGWIGLARDRDLLRRATSSRSRSGPLPAARAAALGADRGARRASAVWCWRDRLALAGDARDLRVHAALGAGARGGLRVGESGAPLWLLGIERSQADLFWLREASRAALLVVSARGGNQAVRAGFDFSRSADRFSATWDPLSGRLLDRPHRAAQLHLRIRGADHSTLFSLRQIRRGFSWQRPREEWRFGLEAALRESPWRATLRCSVDREDEAAPELRLSLQFSRTLPGGISQDFDLRWQARSEADARLVAFALRGGRDWRWLLTLRQSDGARSVFDPLGLAGGSRSLWLGPGQQRWAAALERGGWSLWLDSVRPQGNGPGDLRGGLSWKAEWGVS